jgi:UDP-GlcNAc:undecaprenyl-phosphate GlcNAc-1-phosphate transferase
MRRPELKEAFHATLLWKYDYLPALAGIGVLVFPSVRRAFLDAGLRWFYILLLSFLIAFALTPLCIQLARRFGILDRPGGRKRHLNATPLLGGVAVFAAFSAALLLNGLFTPKLAVILGTAAVLFAVGAADDIREMAAGIKLLVQVACAAMVMAAGVVLRVIPESLGAFAAAGNLFLTLLWIVGITNAMNFFDGMDGLATGLGAIIAFFLGVVAFQTGQPFIGWVAVAMTGACMGFLPYNFRVHERAMVFLGDAGSTVIGYVLACIAVYGHWSESSPVVALASPLLIFWVLIFDLVHISADRFLSGKVLTLKQWIEYVGNDHLHHRMAAVLGGRKKSVLFIYLMSVCLGSSAVLLRNAQPLDAWLLLFQAVILVGLITVLERRGRSLNPPNDDR